MNSEEVYSETLRQLAELEETVRRAVEKITSLRAEREAARAETEKLRAALRERGETLKHLESRLFDYQAEREQTRTRIEQLVAQIDSLTGEKTP